MSMSTLFQCSLNLRIKEMANIRLVLYALLLTTVSIEGEPRGAFSEQESKDAPSPVLPDKATGDHKSNAPSLDKQQQDDTAMVEKVPMIELKPRPLPGLHSPSETNSKFRPILPSNTKETENSENKLIIPPRQIPQRPNTQMTDKTLIADRNERQERTNRTVRTTENRRSEGLLENDKNIGNKATDFFTEMTGKLEETIVDKARDLIDKGKRFITKATQKFDMSKSIERLKPKARSIYDKFQKVHSPLNFTILSENDASRLLGKLANLPTDMQNILVNLRNLRNLTTEQLKKLPADIIPALTDDIMGSVSNMSTDQLVALCDRLVEQNSQPRSLQRALDAGVDCTDLLNKLHFKGRRHPRSQLEVMMKHIRKHKSPSAWTSEKVTEVIRFFGDALSEADIKDIPIATIRKSLRNISREYIPVKSVRQNLARKLMSEYSSPTMWPEDLLANMGRLLEDVSVQKLALLRHGAVLNVAEALTDAGVQKETTRISLVKKMARELTASPDADRIAKTIPWLKANVNFLNNLNLSNLLQALSTVNVTFSPAESNLVAERLEEELMGYEDATDHNKTDYVLAAISKFADGFSMSYLESVANEVLPKICIKMSPVNSRPKSKILLRKLKAGQKQGLAITPAMVGSVFNGADLADVDIMDVQDLVDILPVIKDKNLPHYLARKIANKVAIKVFSDSQAVSVLCNNGFHRLGNLAKYVPPKTIVDMNVIPIGKGDEDCGLNFDDITLTKAQVYAIVDNVRAMLTDTANDDDDTYAFSSPVVRQLGKLSRGLTADDIQGIPLDNDLLSIIEILSEYENELDSSQVEAIVGKIRDYFDITNSNVLSDVDDVTIIQIGRFLQYLNSDFELTKFPKQLRPLISREMGKSSMLKVPNGKTQALLRFALENTKLDNKVKLTDMTRMKEIDENSLMDLGNLRCGLTEDIINKLTKPALEIHLEDIQACPLKEREAKSLVNKALKHNVNILHHREQMATMGGLLLHLREDDLSNIKDNELAEITDYVAKSAKAVDVTIATTEKNGFKRESAAPGIRNVKRRNLIQRTYKSMSKAFGSGKCHELIRLGSLGKDIASLINPSQFERCIDHIGSIEWNPDTARMLLDKIATFKKWGKLNKRKVEENSDYLLNMLPKLSIGLSADEISVLNFTSPESMAILGEVEGFTQQKLEKGFNAWLENKGGDYSLTGEDVDNMQGFVCGASPEYIKSKMRAEIVRKMKAVIGKHMRKCSRDKLNAFANKLEFPIAQSRGDTSLYDIVEMGSLVGGLSQDAIHSLTTSQIKVIEPEVIANMPPEKMKDLTPEQLEDMTYNQVHAITSMQRSYMSKDQMTAIGIVNGSVTVTPFSCTVLAIMLSLLREVFLLCTI